jgi:hypothetical protein
MQFLTKNDQVIDYDFELETSSTFILSLEMKSPNKMFNYIFEQAKNKMFVNKNINYNDVREFSVPVQYLKYVKTFVYESVKNVFKDVEKDNIRCLNYEVKSALFKRFDNDYWKIIIIIGGMYKDDRTKRRKE